MNGGQTVTLTNRLNAVEALLEAGQIEEALTALDHIPSSQCDLRALRLRYFAFALSARWDCANVVASVAADVFGSAAQIAHWPAEAFARCAQAVAGGRTSLSAASHSAA